MEVTAVHRELIARVKRMRENLLTRLDTVSLEKSAEVKHCDFFPYWVFKVKCCLKNVFRCLSYIIYYKTVHS